MKLGHFSVLGFLLALTSGQVLAQQPLHMEIWETRVAWLSSCPSDPPPSAAQRSRSLVIGGLAAVIAPKLIEGAVDAAAEALKAAGQAKTFTTTARSSANFYTVNQDADLRVAVNCLVVVRGVFDESKASPFAWANTSDELNSLQRVVIQMEAKLKPLRGLKYFQLVPQHLSVNDFENFSLFDPKDRDYVMAVSLMVPGATQPFGSAEFSFPAIERGAKFKDGDRRLRAATSLPIAFPAESADATRVKTKRESELAPYLLALDILTPPKPKPFTNVPSLYTDPNARDSADLFCKDLRELNAIRPKKFEINDERCAYKLETTRDGLSAALEAANRSKERAAWARGVCSYVAGNDAKNIAATCSNLANDDALEGVTYTYFTTQLTLGETREGSKLALFLGKALGAAAPEVSTILKDKLLPQTSAQRDAEDEADRSARTTVILADLEVKKAEESLAEVFAQDAPKATDLTAARIALVKAKIEANKAYRKLGISVPYPELS
jgi:hypothetical protein